MTPRPGVQRNFFLILAVLVLLAAAVLAGLLQEIRQLLQQPGLLALEKLRWYAQMLLWVNGGAVVALLGWGGRLVWRVFRSHRYPPPGMLVLRATPVIYGHKAKLLGIVLPMVPLVVVLLTAAVLASLMAALDHMIARLL